MNTTPELSIKCNRLILLRGAQEALTHADLRASFAQGPAILVMPVSQATGNSLANGLIKEALRDVLIANAPRLMSDLRSHVSHLIDAAEESAHATAERFLQELEHGNAIPPGAGRV